MYVTPANLIDGPDSLQELSELFQVPAQLLALFVAGGNTTEWPPEELTVAAAAVASIEQRIAQAQGEIDARLAQRGYSLPLPEPQRFPILTVWARAIARYHLHPQRDRTSEDTGRVERDYRDAIRALALVAAGNLSLGAGDPLATDPNDPDGGAVRVSGNDRLFTRKSLGSL